MIALYFALALWLFSTNAAGEAVLTNSNYLGITVGQPFTITWSGASSTVTLTLVSGSPSSLTTVLTIGSDLTGTSYIWTPPTSIPSGVYAFKIYDGIDFNYSTQFTISGEADVQSSSAASKSNTISESTVTTTPLVSTAAQTATTPTVTPSQMTTLSTTTSPQMTTPLITSSNLSPLTTSSSPTLLSNSSTLTTHSTVASSLTTAPSVPSPTSNVQPVSDGGLGTGGKAGISVGVVLGAAIAIFAIWLILRRRRIQREERTRRDGENESANSPERGPEMMTSANTHEIEGKPAVEPQIAEMECQISAKGEKIDSLHDLPIAHDNASIGRNTQRGTEELEARHSQILRELSSEDSAVVRKALPLEMPTQSNVHEVATANNVGSDWEHLRPSELDSRAIDKHIPELSMPIAASKAPLSASTKLQSNELIVETSTSAPVISSADSGPDELEALQRRMEQVRADKERLERIQQLKDLEAELQRDIMAAQKRRQDAASGS